MSNEQNELVALRSLGDRLRGYNSTELSTELSTVDADIMYRLMTDSKVGGAKEDPVNGFDSTQVDYKAIYGTPQGKNLMDKLVNNFNMMERNERGEADEFKGITFNDDGTVDYDVQRQRGRFLSLVDSHGPETFSGTQEEFADRFTRGYNAYLKQNIQPSTTRQNTLSAGVHHAVLGKVKEEAEGTSDKASLLANFVHGEELDQRAYDEVEVQVAEYEEEVYEDLKRLGQAEYDAYKNNTPNESSPDNSTAIQDKYDEAVEIFRSRMLKEMQTLPVYADRPVRAFFELPTMNPSDLLNKDAFMNEDPGMKERFEDFAELVLHSSDAVTYRLGIEGSREGNQMLADVERDTRVFKGLAESGEMPTEALPEDWYPTEEEIEKYGIAMHTGEEEINPGYLETKRVAINLFVELLEAKTAIDNTKTGLAETMMGGVQSFSGLTKHAEELYENTREAVQATYDAHPDIMMLNDHIYNEFKGAAYKYMVNYGGKETDTSKYLNLWPTEPRRIADDLEINLN